MKNNHILEEFDDNIDLYKSLSMSVESLISILIDSEYVIPHSINCRVKDRNSLSRKIEKKEKYSSLQQIMDIVGLRIITNYSDEVDKIAEIIEKEFLIDAENSIDKRSSLDSDRFGYLSLHYIVSLSPERCKLVEYKRFSGLKFEIQIRSILQHTWAEIEHDIGYKAKFEVPKPIRRKFSMLAGLLELADEQFVQIRDDLVNYALTVQKTIDSAPEDIGIDKISIYEYINTSPTIKKIDEKIIKLTSFDMKPIYKDSFHRDVKLLQYFNINSIAQLEKELIDNEKLILKRAKDVDGNNDSVSPGISIFYLIQVLAAKTLKENEIIDFLYEMGIGMENEREEFAQYLSDLAV